MQKKCPTEENRLPVSQAGQNAMTVLIAEDDPSSRRLLEKVIQSFGHQVVSAGNGQEAWEQFQTGDFNFVITDWMMPGLDGLELCRRIRVSARRNYTYIIMVTSSAGRENVITGMTAGADEFIIKPVNPRELQARMRAAERILKLQEELREKNQQLELMNARLQRLSRIDALTQLGNRLAFEETVTDFQDRAARYGRPYGVVMCDVDGFKAYNDNHGHLAGDEVLRRIAAFVKNCLRPSDGAFRYGGDEILVLLAEQSLAESALTAERLRATIETLELMRGDVSAAVCVTISCGVAACPVNESRIPDWEDVLEWADQALYRAKALGRNRVELAEVGLHTLAI